MADTMTDRMTRPKGAGTTTLVTVLAVALLAAACSSGPAASTTTTTTSTGATPASGHTTTVWLCRPGMADDPCAGNLGATSVSADGATSLQPAQPASNPAYDCFYVYPTVSTEPTDNADLTVQPAETAAAIAQASRFSQVCRVWAPMYRQRTEKSLAKGLGNDPHADQVAYASLLSGWKDYVANDNHGRPVVFIGHSQGAAMLIDLLRSQIDPNPALRKLLVSAIILGGNVQVPTGGLVGGSFQHIPACTSASETGCVIAYSSFLKPPPADSLFGRPGTGVSLQSDQTQTTGEQVLCTNPAALGGGSGPLDPYFVLSGRTGAVTAVTTPWVTDPGLYTAQCESTGGATWLQVTVVHTAGDPRPQVRQIQGPEWGLHGDDVNLALGNLVQIVAAQEAAFR